MTKLGWPAAQPRFTTMMLYRDQPDRFRYVDHPPPEEIRNLYPHIHYGELMQELGLAKAQRHEVAGSVTTQHSMVFFAIPNWELKLPDGTTVGAWLEERLSRSRYNGYSA